MDFQQIRDFVNPAVAQATGLQEVENLSMPVPVAYVPVQLVIDGALSLTSENPVQNKVIAVAIQNLDGRITAVEGQFSEGVTEAVNNWLAAHPEATTTVQDGAISYAKLDTNLKGKVDEISELKSALDNVYADGDYSLWTNIFTPIDNLSGGYYDNNGDWQDYANYNTTKLIPLNGATTLKCVMQLTMGVNFWDENKAFILRKAISNQNAFSVPSSAMYVSLTYSKKHKYPLLLSNAFISDNLKKNNNYIYTDVFTPTNQLVGEYYNPNGEHITTDPNTSSTALIPILNFKKIKLVSSAQSIITFWDEEQNYLEGRVLYNNNSYNVPTTAKYLRASFTPKNGFPILYANIIDTIFDRCEPLNVTYVYDSQFYVSQKNAAKVIADRTNNPIVITQTGALYVKVNGVNRIIGGGGTHLTYPSFITDDGDVITIELENNKAFVLNTTNSQLEIINFTDFSSTEHVLLAGVHYGLITDGIYSEIIAELETQIQVKSEQIESGFGSEVMIIDSVGSDHTFIGNDLYYFKTNANDHSDYNLCNVYTVNLEEKTYSLKISFFQNWGHCNSIDYNSGNDCFILGNGSGTEEMEYNEFYIIPNASQLAETVDGGRAPLDTYGITYRVSEWGDDEYGRQLNAIWGDSNCGRNDIAFLISNNGTFMFIRMIQLGKGSVAFENGTIITNVGDDTFNGTWRVIKRWITAYSTDVALQGGTYHKGSLYFGLGHDGLYVEELKLLNNGNVHAKRRKFNHYDSNGTAIAYTTEGLAIKNNLMFIGVDTDYIKKTFVYDMP